MRSAAAATATLIAAAWIVTASVRPALAQSAHDHDHAAMQTPPAGGAPAAGAPAQPATAPVAVPKDPALPADEAGAKEAIEKTPRHAEYASIPVEGRATPVKAFVVYPERKDKAPVIVVIHEIF